MTTRPKQRDYAREDSNRATVQVKARLLPEDDARLKALQAQGVTVTDVMLAGLDAIEAKMQGNK